MDMRVDHRRHHGLTGEIDVRRAGRHGDGAFLSDGGNLAVLNDERTALDGGAGVTDNEARAFVNLRVDRTARSARTQQSIRTH